ncbi:MAG: SGNH/GDSL hydrolase family protein, partial [Planctomycetota bacterium]
MSTTRRADSSRPAANIALLFASLLLSLLLAEFVVRLTGAAPGFGIIQFERFQLSQNPELLYEPLPGSETNDLGYRDRNHALERSTTHRIVILGDSIAAGFAVHRSQDIFPDVVEQRLQEAGFDVEVINLGVVGYNTAQEVETLRVRGLQYDPDLVVLEYCLNDHYPPEERILAGLARHRRQEAVVPHFLARGLASSSALYRLLKFGIAWAPRDDEEAKDQETKKTLSSPVPGAFEELAVLSREHGFPTVVTVFPNLARGSGHDTHLFDYPIRFQRQHDEVAGLSARHGFEHLDLLEPFRECSRNSSEKIHVDVIHPSAFGHRCAGERIAGFLADSV